MGREFVDGGAKKELTKVNQSDIIKTMDKDIIRTNPSDAHGRYSITQEQIDDILDNELSEYEFPVTPVYNSRISVNGRTIAEVYPWGQLKRITAIEIGKQDFPNRDFLIDTLIHEYLEADILAKQYTNGFYKKLSISGDDNRHKRINKEIDKYFKKREELR